MSVWKEFFQKQGPAIASASIALMALGFTIYNSYLDRSFKEASIKPSLQAEADADDLRFVLVNRGIGPAEIKKIATKFGSECAFLNRGGSEGFDQKLFIDTVHNVGDWFIDPLDQLLQKSVWEPTTRKLHVQPLTPNEVIAAGERVVLFELEREQLEAARQKLDSLDLDSSNRLVERFLERVLTMPYYIEYCSLTGNYCRGAERISEHCGIK